MAKKKRRGKRRVDYSPQSKRVIPGKVAASSVSLGEVLVLMALALFVFLIYTNTLEGPFVFDDKLRIEENPAIRVTELNIKTLLEAGFDRRSAQSPLGNITFALNYYLHQYNLLGYHIVNVSIHILTGIFLFFFIKTTSSIHEKQHLNPFIPESLHVTHIAFFAALIWLVHPVQTESVTYIVQRLNSMAAMFYVLALLLYARGRMSVQGIGKLGTGNSKLATRNPQPATRSHYFWFAGSALAWVLALGSKQNAATLPVFIFLYEWYFFQDLSKEWLRRHLRYIVGIVIVFGVVAFMYLGWDPLARFAVLPDYASKEFTIMERMLTQFRVVIYYLSLIFYPHPSRLNLDYDFALSRSLVEPVTTVVCLVFILGLLGLALYLAKKERLFSFCILWFFGNLVIESSIIPLAIIFEHRVYLPSMLVIMGVVTWAFRYIRPKAVVLVGLSVVAGAFCLWTYERNKVWGDEVRLWRDCVEKSPKKARPHNSLGIVLTGRGNLKEAIDHFSEALRIQPDLAEAHSNLGAAFVRGGLIQKAIRHYVEALRLNPDSVDAHNNLGAILQREGRLKEAQNHYLESVRIAPDVAETHYNLGSVLLGQGDFKWAVRHFSEALRLTPDFAEAHYNLGLALESQGQAEKAISHFSESLRLKRDFAKGHYHLGVMLLSKGNLQEAMHRFSEALRINPNFAEGHHTLGVVLLSQGKRTGAIEHFSEAVRIDPNHQEARKRLDALLEEMGNGKETGSSVVKP